MSAILGAPWKHTPGPWDHGGYEVEAADGTLICNMSGWKNESQTKANARLIAAAPDMLEALERLLDEDRYLACELSGTVKEPCESVDCDECAPFRTARAALAKAKGEG